MNEPKILILTTNRTEDGAPVYAPCGDLRELIAQWREKYTNYDTRRAGDNIRAAQVNSCANALETVLQPSGDLLVARPLQIGVEYPAGDGDDHEAVNRAIVSED